MEQITPRNLSDRDLIEQTKQIADHERQTTAELVALLAEVDTRRLYLGEGCSSLFAYCTQVLHFSEHAAYGRIEAARLSRRYPRVLELLADGAANLTTIGLLAPRVTDDNAEALLEAIRHKSKRDVERLVAGIEAYPDIAPLVRKVAVPAIAAPLSRLHPPAAPAVFSASGREPEPRPVPVHVPAPSATSRPTVAPLSSDRYLIKVTVSAATYARLRRAQDLLRHSVPDGDPVAIIDRGLTLLIERLEKATLGRTARPRPQPAAASPVTSSSRHVPAAVRREVWTRDEGRCAFVGAEGRCTSTAFLEIHHVVPFAVGGKTVEENLSLRCRAHNGHEAEKFFGERAMLRRRGRRPKKTSDEARSA